MSLDMELFISEVKKRPILYNSNSQDKNDRALKKLLWAQLCEKFVPNWNELSDAEKYEKGDELQKKWKNLRTCFKREYVTQMNTSNTTSTSLKKKRKYIYYDQLLFLVDSVKMKPEEHSCDVRIESCEDTWETDNEESEESEHTKTKVINEKSEPNKFIAVNKSEPMITIPERVVKRKMIFQKSNNEKEKDIDEDKYFLLSLLPSFRKFDEDQKFIARTEIMNVMRRVRLLGTHQNATQYANQLHHDTTKRLR